MSQVFIAYDEYAIEGVDDEFIHFVFDMTISMADKSAESEMGLIITTNDRIKDLNFRYRGKDKPTNVLSFASSEIAKDFVSADIDANYLGDVYISSAELMREAGELGIAPKDRFVQLFVHGVLHLFGFDHENAKDAEVMESMEDKITAAIL
ncbi:rRNA maturation RNase YbeY [Patescibacteria group bacterium]|nr:rRNA maturation RNase YbeY [Patescibacteria group bacterium]